MSRSDLLNTSRWLEAHSDRGAGLTTLPRNIVLSDISDDGDHRLVLTDLKLGDDVRSRLKVYKGTMLTSDQILPDVPCGVISFYMDTFEPKVPAIAVACGSDLLIYKNNKPYFKFSSPTLPLDPVEREVWRKIKDEHSHDFATLIENLKTVPFNSLSARSQQLLSTPPPKIEDFIGRYFNTDLTKNTPITCLSTLKKSSLEPQSVACPVVATEAGQIFILDPQSFSIIHQAIVSTSRASPYMMESFGLFDVEFRIAIACREGYVCLLRRGWLEGKIIFQATSHIVDMVYVPGDNFIMMATSDSLLHCYSKKGNKLWSLSMTNPITCLCLVPLKHLNTCLLAVGLRGGNINLFKGRQRVDNVQTPDTPSAITFGQMGQEEHVMVIITLNGTINFKILKRTADFNLSKQDSTSTPILQSKPLPLPKRSKLFLEQSMRERQNAIDMHQNFQQDLVRLRLTTARALVQNQCDQSGIGNEKELVKLSAQVLGLGPKFTLILTLENMNNDRSLVGLSLLFHCKATAYKLSTYEVVVPLVPPALSYRIETKVEEVNLEDNPIKQQEEMGILVAQVIRVFVLRKDQAQPVLAASINMPSTDLSAPAL